jgi:hypothetical protein
VVDGKSEIVEIVDDPGHCHYEKHVLGSRQIDLRVFALNDLRIAPDLAARQGKDMPGGLLWPLLPGFAGAGQYQRFEARVITLEGGTTPDAGPIKIDAESAALAVMKDAARKIAGSRRSYRSVRGRQRIERRDCTCNVLVRRSA